MSTIIKLMIAAVVFYIIYYFLALLLPGANIRSFVTFLVVIAAIVYLLSELTGYWPWGK